MNSEKLIKSAKVFIKKIIFLAKSFLLLDKLNEFESAGDIGKFTQYKFIPKTQLEVPFSLGRGPKGFAFGSQIMNDPMFAMIYQVSKNKSFNYIRDYFFEKLRNESNLSCADVLGLENNKKLKKYPPWSIVLPWENDEIDIKHKNFEEKMRASRFQKSILYDFDYTTTQENYLYSFEMAESQVKQSIRLFESICKRGYISKLGIPSLNILVSNGKWRWFISQGKHRSFILYCLNYESFTGIIDSIIYREESNVWPNVLNGLYSQKEAELVFDNLFEGEKSILSFFH